MGASDVLLTVLPLLLDNDDDDEEGEQVEETEEDYEEEEDEVEEPQGLIYYQDPQFEPSIRWNWFIPAAIVLATIMGIIFASQFVSLAKAHPNPERPELWSITVGGEEFFHHENVALLDWREMQAILWVTNDQPEDVRLGWPIDWNGNIVLGLEVGYYVRLGALPEGPGPVSPPQAGPAGSVQPEFTPAPGYPEPSDENPSMPFARTNNQTPFVAGQRVYARQELAEVIGLDVEAGAPGRVIGFQGENVFIRLDDRRILPLLPWYYFQLEP